MANFMFIVPIRTLYAYAMFDVCDGEPLNAYAIELVRRLERKS